jgi:competence ComEA-like helix-hairpin-helix protein
VARRRFLCANVAFLLVTSALIVAGQSKKQPPAKPLDLNTATAEQLQQLPGIGPTTAKAIVRFREKSGPFRRVEDLLAVRGISKRRLEALRAYVTVVPRPPAAASKDKK